MPEICCFCHRELLRAPDKEYIAVYGDGSEHSMCVLCYADAILIALGRKEPTPRQKFMFPAIHTIEERTIR